MKKILFIRHGATAGNLEKRYIGITDEPLVTEGTQQVMRLRERGITADYVFVSPLLRARQTAEILFPGKQVTIVDELKETNFGQFEGKSAAEMVDDIAYRTWVDTMCLGPIPGGEDISAFKTRCCCAFQDLIKAVSDNTIVALVTHGGVIMSILERFAVPRRGFYEYQVQNGSCLFGEYDGQSIHLKKLR